MSAAEAAKTDDEVAAAAGTTCDLLERDILSSHGTNVVAFLQSGCHLCAPVEEALKEIKKEDDKEDNDNNNNAPIITIIDAKANFSCYSLAKKYDVIGTPTLIKFVDGKEVERLTGGGEIMAKGGGGGGVGQEPSAPGSLHDMVEKSVRKFVTSSTG